MFSCDMGLIFNNLLFLSRCAYYGCDVTNFCLLSTELMGKSKKLFIQF